MNLLLIQNIINLSTESSKPKIPLCYDKKDNNIGHNKYLNGIFHDMINAFMIKSHVSMTNDDRAHLIQIFKDFDVSVNNMTTSKFQSSIDLIEHCYRVKLHISDKFDSIIELHFLGNNDDFIYISIICHAIHTFCNMFEYDYNGLNMYICLDNYTRSLDKPNNIKTINEAIQYYKRESTAFNVSGVTYRHQKKIIATKKQEILKLIFHELVHYIGLDSELRSSNIIPVTTWAITRNNLNLSEAYTEFVSVILVCMYQSIHYVGLQSNHDNIIKKQDVFDIFYYFIEIEKKYSILLSAKVLNLYGYTSKTCKEFFRTDKFKDQPKCECPIYIWEYVILRCHLFLKLDKLLSCLNGDLKINSDNVQKVVSYMKIDKDTINKIANAMSCITGLNDIGYLAIDLDWQQYN